MTRLPTVNGDSDSWGTVLNTYLSDVAGSTALSAACSSGDSSVDVAVVVPGMMVGSYIVIDAYTPQAEVRKITSITSKTLSFSQVLEYSHASGNYVLLADGPLTTQVWGCKGDNSTDDHTALQEAIVQCGYYGEGIWLDGQDRLYHIVSQPVLIYTSSKLRNLRVKAKSTFSPAESNNAMGMSFDGKVISFTADASTDVITATAHDLGGDNVGVVFQGSDLPGGLTAGKFYYARDRTANTFKVSDTDGGAAVDITSAGSGGRVFCDVYAGNAKPYFDGVYFVGDTSITGLNGLLLSVQQQGWAKDLRADNFDGSAITMKGQQYVMYNLELINNSTAFTLDNMTELYVYGINIEQCDNGIYTASGGAFDCAFYGCHFETSGSTYGVSGENAIYLDNGGQNLIFSNIHMAGSTTATLLKSDAASAGATSYIIQGARWSGQQSSGSTMVNDVNRGISLDQWTDCNGNLLLFIAPRLPSSQSFDDPYPIAIAGPGGRYIALGSQNDDQAQITVRAGSSQTGNPFQVLDSSGTDVFSVGTEGTLVINNGPNFSAGSGSPESSVSAPVGSIYLRTDGGSSTSFYVKESGTGNTGWVAK